jgi:hypothetical protein
VKQDQIEAEIIAARERLAKNLSELEYSEGQIKIERVIGSVVGTLVGLKIIRKIF